MQPKEGTNLISIALPFSFQSPLICLPFADTWASLFGQGMVIIMMAPHLAEAGATQKDIDVAYLVFGLVFAAGTSIGGFVSAFLVSTGV